jgi:hypothetical protein
MATKTSIRTVLGSVSPFFIVSDLRAAVATTGCAASRWPTRMDI